MFENKNNTRHGMALAALLTLSGISGSAWADAYEDAAKKWIESEFNPSTLSPEQQRLLVMSTSWKAFASSLAVPGAIV